MRELKTILVPTDYSGCADDALRLAGTFARGIGARLLVLHLLPWPPDGFGHWLTDDWIATERERLQAHARAVIAPSGSDGAITAMEVEIELGSGAADLVWFAIERKADLIVMGTHGRTGLKHVLLGSVAEKTVRLAPCPVLTVRGGAAAGGRLTTQAAPPPTVRRGEVDRLVGRVPVTVTSDDLLSTARDRMRKEGIRHLAVVDAGRLVGIVSDRDVVPHLAHLEHTRVNAVMTPYPRTIVPDASVETAARIMIDERVRALLVVDGERLIGILSATDILEDYVRAARRAV